MKVSRQFGHAIVLATIILLLGACASSPWEKAEPNAKLRPINLVLVTVDTLRADRLHCYGYDAVETPNLDALAARGVLFAHAFAQTPLTPPSHASMFTGQNPNVHGVRNTGGFVLPQASTTLAEILQRQGWNTAAFVGASVLRKIIGLNQGFAVYDDEMPKPKGPRELREDPERPAGAVVDRAVSWLEKQSGEPYFLWVHVFDPHIPYEPPAPFESQYRNRPYDGEVAYTDYELGRLFDAVAKKAPLENTLMVVLADHGESLSDHGEYTHGVFLYDSTLHIPMLMAGSDIPAGLRVKQQVRTIDLLPTILELMGGGAPEDVQGVSLVPAFSGKPVDTEPSYHETLFPKMNMGWAELRALRTSRWKFIQAPRKELYDLEADPSESKNVIERYPQEAGLLEAQLHEIASSEEKVQARMADDKTMKQLQSLGYLSGFAPPEYELSGEGIDPKDRLNVLQLLQVAVPLGSGLTPAKRLEMLQAGLKTDPTNSALYYHLGAELEKSGRHKQALDLYQTALNKGIRSGKLHARIGDLQLRFGDKAAAIVAYEAAGRINPYDLESQNNLATAYLESGRGGDAQRLFDFILTIEPHAPAYNGLGLIAIQKRDITSAQTNFERAVSLDPDLVESQLNLGLIYKMKGDRVRARACFTTFVAKAPRAQYGHLIPQVEEEIAALQ